MILVKKCNKKLHSLPIHERTLQGGTVSSKYRLETGVDKNISIYTMRYMIPYNYIYILYCTQTHTGRNLYVYT